MMTCDHTEHQIMKPLKIKFILNSFQQKQNFSQIKVCLIQSVSNEQN